MTLTLEQRLPRIGIFAKAALEPGAIDTLLAILEPRHFKRGQTIFREADAGGELYLLHRGRVRIQKLTPNGEMYTVVILDEGQNNFFGEAALMETERRSATAMADTDCECFIMTKERFFQLGEEHPRIGLLITREISNLVSHRLHKANQDIVTLFTALVSEVEGDLIGMPKRRPAHGPND